MEATSDQSAIHNPKSEIVNSSCWPQCRGELRPTNNTHWLQCQSCGERYQANRSKLPSDPNPTAEA